MTLSTRSNKNDGAMTGPALGEIPERGLYLIGDSFIILESMTPLLRTSKRKTETVA